MILFKTADGFINDVLNGISNEYKAFIDAQNFDNFVNNFKGFITFFHLF